MKISVIIKEPDKKPRHVYISNTLENLQKTVGGYIEVITLCSDLVVICNEEGKIKKITLLLLNCTSGFCWTGDNLRCRRRKLFGYSVRI